MKYDYHIIVIDAGSAGLVTASSCSVLGAKVALIEREKMGGDCLNTGCVPSKAFLKCAHLAKDIKTSEKFGLVFKIRIHMTLTLKILNGDFCICQMDKNSRLPNWIISKDFYSITKTDDELSMVFKECDIPKDIIVQKGFKCIKIEGKLDFSLVGVIAKLSNILADENISIFIVSTYNTDYFLVNKNDLPNTIKALHENEYIISCS